MNGSPIQVLVDGDSDHNFVQTRVETFLQMSIEVIASFAVVVGSVQWLRCDGVVRQVSLTIQGCNLVLDLYVLQLGVDVVLGTSWLSTLGRLVTDYAECVFESVHEGNTIIDTLLCPSSTAT